MKKWILLTLVIAISAFLLTHQIWTPSPDAHPPTSSQLPFFILLSMIESLALGLSVSFLVYGYPLVKKAMEKNSKFSLLLYLSIAWSLGNWWFHDNLHIANGLNMQGLLYIEYSFHVTLIIAAAIIAYAYFHTAITTKVK